MSKGDDMYAMNIEEYERWNAVCSTALRFWIRTWIDSLHAGTHVHWQLSAVSRLTLAYLWEFLAQQEDRYVWRQRASAKRLAYRLDPDPGFVGQIPPPDNWNSQAATMADHAAWNAFFKHQREQRGAIRQGLFGDALDAIRRDADPVHVFAVMNSLFACLTLDGFTTDQLLRAVANRVVHPGDQSLGTTCEERFEHLLESWRTAVPVTYVGYTPLLFPSGTSNVLRRSWASFRFDSVNQIGVFEHDGVRTEQEGTWAVQLGLKGSAQPFIVSRIRCIGGVAEQHRRAARQKLAVRVQRHPELSSFVLPERSFFKRADEGAAEHYFDTGFNRIDLEVGKLADDSGAELYYRAARDLFDEPEETIRSLIVGAELRWGEDETRTPNEVLANAYRWSLRRALGGVVADYMARVRSIVANRGGQAHPVLHLLGTWPEGADTRELLSKIQHEAGGVDRSLELRFQELAEWRHGGLGHGACLSGRPCTFDSINDHMDLIRGIRNSSTHFGSPPPHLYGVMLYLAKLAFRAFAAACLRESQVHSSGAGGIGTE